MARIPLRSYHREIENLIDRGQIEEAIAHCKNILKQYPKHIETYRLLGKAYLESQRYSEASDILQRLLSVVPDDFVAQLGMSVIREDEGNLDAAIWHMERAYEVQPFNRAVQDELRRLYGRRDGAEPPRIRLTRGSLVRMYARGDLFSQAIAETRSALAEDHQRLDLLVLLAQMYYLSGQKVEAAEISSSLIGKLPYCLEANRILMDILPATSRAEEARIFQHRVYDLDPYAEFVTPNTPTSAQVPEQAVMVERVDWQPSMQDGQGPDWTKTIGVKWEEDKQENLPDWLNTFGPETAVPASSAIVPAQPKEVIPEFMREAGWSQAEHASDVPPPPTAAEEAEPEKSENDLELVEIPEWLKEMAPKPLAVKAEPQDKGLDWLEGILPAAGDAEIPSVTQAGEPEPLPLEPPSQAVVPDLSQQNLPPPSGLEEIETQADSLAVPIPVPTIPPTPELEAAGIEDEVPDWLKGFGQDDQVVPPLQTPISPDLANPAPETEPPDWLTPQETTSKEEFVWIPADQAEAVQPAEDIPAWLREDTSENQPEGIEIPAEVNQNLAEAKLETPTLDQAAWGAENAIVGATEVQPAEEVSGEDLSKWLEELKNTASETQPPEQTAAETVEAEEIPAWLRSMQEPAAETVDIPQEQSFPTQVSEEVPAGMPEEGFTSPAPTSQDLPLVEEAASNPQDMDIDSAMAWLEALAAKQGADAESLKITPPEQRTETPPDWISDYAQPGPANEAEEPVAAEKEVLPAWLAGETIPESAVQEPTQIATDVIPTEQKPGEDEEFPTWISETKAVEQAEIPVIPVVSAGQPLETVLPPEPFESPLEEKTQPVAVHKADPGISPQEVQEEASVAAEPKLDDMDAAMAWMEALAAKQGAEADSLKIAAPENRSEAIPDWIASLSAAEPQFPEDQGTAPEPIQKFEEPVESAWKPEEELASPVSTEAVPPVPADEIPDWLKGLESEAEPPQAVVETTQPPSIDQEPIPDWMAEPEPISSPSEPSSTWMAEAETPLEPPQVAQPASPVEAAPAPEDMESAMAWLEALASKQGAEADSLKITTPDQRNETPPDWIAELAKNQPETVSTAQPEAVEEPAASVEEPPAVAIPEIPTLASSIEPPPLDVSQPQAQESSETEIPFWLLNYEQEQNQKAKIWENVEPTQPVASTQPSATDDSITIWLQQHHPDTGELNMPAAESLLPQSGAPEAPRPAEAISSPLSEAQAAIQNGNIQNAIQRYTQAIQSGENLDIVVNDLRQAVSIHPSDVDIWQTLGDAYIRADRIQEALDAYTRAEELLK